jgi:hypothetical protein
MKTALSSVVLILAVALGGCGGPKWVVIKQASSNPMTATTSFKVEKAAFAPTFHVGAKTEQEWMSEKKAGTKENWEGDKIAMTEKFAEGFLAGKDNLLVANANGAGVFSVRAKFVQYEPGFYAFVASAPTQLDADVEFLDASGVAVDVIRVHVKQASLSTGDGARRCAQEIGMQAAKYLKERAGLK